MLIAISLWESKANTEAYNTNTYPEVLRTFARMIDGTPKAQTFEAVTSTFHHVAVAVSEGSSAVQGGLLSRLVEGIERKLAGGEVHVYLEHPEMGSWPCPECGVSCPRYDHQGERQWRRLDTCQYRTLVHARPPGTECGEHGVRVVKMPWAERSSRFTALMEPLVIDWREAMLTAIAPSQRHLKLVRCRPNVTPFFGRGFFRG